MQKNNLYITFTKELKEATLEHIYWMVSQHAQVKDSASITECDEIVNTTVVNLCEADTPEHFCYEFVLESLDDGDALYELINDEFGEVLINIENITETKLN